MATFAPARATGHAPAPGLRAWSSRFSLNSGQWSVLAALLVLSTAAFASNTVAALIHHRIYSGADGGVVQDQLQYLAWATDAAHHLLIANLYGIGNGGHVFLHPIWLLTGILHVYLGVPYAVELLVWKLLAVVALFVAVRLYALRFFPTEPRRVTIALLLALFLVTPAYVAAVDFHLAVAGSKWVWMLSLESCAVEWLSGYFPIALAVAAMIGYLLLLERILEAPDGGRVVARPAVLAGLWGAAAAFLHPWQGMELALITGAAILWNGRGWRHGIRLLVPGAMTALPLFYYFVLARIDPGWAVSNGTSALDWANIPPIAWLTTFGPSLLAMAPGFCIRPETVRDRLVRFWPVAVVLTCLIVPTAKFHSFDGLAVPAAILTIQGWPRARAFWLEHGGRASAARLMPALAVFTLTFSTVPAVLWLLDNLRAGGQRDAQLASPTSQALAYLATRPHGGVLTTYPVGMWVPIMADDPTWIGHFVWTPSFEPRHIESQWLFGFTHVRVTPAAARFFVNRTHARYVLAPCGTHTPLARILGPDGFSSQRFGCVTLFTRRS